MTIRILLADDDFLVRRGLAMLLSAQPGMELVGEATDGVEAVALARQLVPDIVLMDIQMPGLDGVEATARITADDFGPDPSRTVSVLVITGFSADEAVLFAALRAGASGFVMKDSVPTDLVTAIERVARGDSYLDASVTHTVIADIRARPVPAKPVPGILDRLTPREREILALVAHGFTNQDIADELTVAVATVRTHVSRILIKADCCTRAQAVVVAYQNRLVTPGEEPPSAR